MEKIIIQNGIRTEVLENKKADLKSCLLSATILAEGDNLQAFIKEWRGTIQWIGSSPYRKMHRRKNWFVGIEIFDVKERLQWNPKEVKFETCRASGPGGQNINKVETAVRGIHIPSGIRVLAWQTSLLTGEQQARWQEHDALERGNAVKTIMGDL